MLLPRMLAPLRAAAGASQSLVPSTRAIDVLRRVNASKPASPTLSFIRNSTSLSQGRANGAKDGPGKRLGAKKTAGEFVIPGHIIFRQRGTAWFPGENCAMGRDHCIYATQPGYVRYYRDPLRHPTRQYIGIVFNKEDKLPYPPNAARKRRLGMIAVREEQQSQAELQTVGHIEASAKSEARKSVLQAPVFRERYVPRETSWSIGRAAERKGVKVSKFDRNDRFKIWRKRLIAQDRAAKLRANMKGKKGKKK